MYKDKQVLIKCNKYTYYYKYIDTHLACGVHFTII